MQVWNVLHAARWKYRTQKSRQKLPSLHHRTNLLGYIFATKACIDNRKKLVKHQYVLHMFSYMVNFGPLTPEIRSTIWGTPANFNRFASWQRYCTASDSGRQLNFAALNRGRHLCSARRPSRWALAHILILFYIIQVVKIIWHQDTSPPHMDGLLLFTKWRQGAPHLIHALLSPPKFKSQTASQFVQPFLHSSWQRVAILLLLLL